MIVRSVTALMRTTRWRRFIVLKVGSDREGQNQSAVPGFALGWMVGTRTQCVIRWLNYSILANEIDTVIGRNAIQGRDIGTDRGDPVRWLDAEWIFEIDRARRAWVG